MAGIENTQSVGSIGRSFDSERGLSIEGLLAVCQSRMSDLDADVKRRLSGQQTRGKLQSELSDFLSTMKKLSGGNTNWENPEDRQKWVGSMKSQVDAALKSAEACGDTAAANSLREMQKTIADAQRLPPGEANKLLPEQISAMVSKVESLQKVCSSNAELEMIDIQQLMSKRSQLLQMTTNMLNSANDSINKIVGNIR